MGLSLGCLQVLAQISVQLVSGGRRGYHLGRPSGLSVRVEVPNATDVTDPVLAFRAPWACASLTLRCLTGARFTSHRDCEACNAGAETSHFVVLSLEPETATSGVEEL